MSNFLFGHFWLWLTVALVASVASFLMAVQRRTWFWLVAAKIVPIFFSLLLVVNICVVTDREAIREQLDNLIAACTAGDADAFGMLLDDDFSATGMTKKEFQNQARGAFARMNIVRVRLSDLEIKPPVPMAVVKLASFSHVVAKGGTDFGWIPSDWELTFRKRGKTWLLYDVRPLSLFRQPIQDIREIFSRSLLVQ